jgi:hypothetical protein
VRSNLRNFAQAQAMPVSDLSDSESICPHRCRTYNSKPFSKKIILPGARTFYLIVVHNNRTLHDAVHLVRAIRDPRNIIAIHFDQKGSALSKNNDTILHKELEECSCGSIIRIESVYDVKWGQWSMNLPTLWGLQLAATAYKDQWDVFINLSGDTLPVYTADTMALILSELPYNFVTSSSCETGLLPTNVYAFPSFWHKRNHYTQSDTLVDPSFEYIESKYGSWHNATVQTHFGSQWMILQPDFCFWVIQQLGETQSLASQFRDYLVDHGFLMTDETFFASLLVQVHLFQASLPRTDKDGNVLWRNGSSSQISAVRYERMDEHAPSAFGYFPVDQRYSVPNASKVEQPRPWGPYFLGVYDLAGVRDSGALFVRKVSSKVDHNMIHLFPVNHSNQIPYISWPDHVEVSEKPDWEKIKARLMAQQTREKDQGDQEVDVAGTDDDEEL